MRYTVRIGDEGKADELEFSSVARLGRPAHVEIDYQWAGGLIRWLSSAKLPHESPHQV
jgi:hypothetical protein